MDPIYAELAPLRARQGTVLLAWTQAIAVLSVLRDRDDESRAARVEWRLIAGACRAEAKRLTARALKLANAAHRLARTENGRGLAGQCPAGIVAAKTPVVRGAGKPRRGRLRNESPSPVKPAPSPGAC